MQSELPPSTESTPDEPSTPIEPKGVWARFSRAQKIVASIGLVILILPILGAAGFIAVNGVKDWNALGDVITRLSIFTLVIIGIFYAVAKAKSRSAAWASVITLLTLSTCFSGLMVAGFVGAARSHQRNITTKKVESSLAQLADRTQKAIESDTIQPELTRQNAEFFRSMVDDAFKAEAPEVQAAVRAVADLTKALAESVATYQETLRPFVDAGGLDASTMTTSGAARQRRAMLEGPRTRLRLVMQLSDTFKSSSLAAIDASGARGRIIEGFKSGLANAPASDLRKENFQLESLLIENFDATLSVLEAYDGQWSVESSGKVMFDAEIADRAVPKYNALSRTRDELMDRQTAVQAKMIELAKSRATPGAR